MAQYDEAKLTGVEDQRESELLSLYSEFEAQKNLHEKRLGKMGTVRLWTFLGSVACLGVAVLTNRPDSRSLIQEQFTWWLFASFVLLNVFAVECLIYNRIRGDEDFAKRVLDRVRRELKRLKGEWTEFEDNHGAVFMNREHAYTDDLDVFGRGSLFQLVNRASSKPAQAKLAGWMNNLVDVQSLPARQDALRDLGKRLRFQILMSAEELRLRAREDKTKEFIDWMQSPESDPKIPALFRLLRFYPLITLPCLWIWYQGGFLNFAALLPLLGSLAINFYLKRHTLGFQDKMEYVGEGLLGYQKMFELFDAEAGSFSSAELLRLRDSIASGGQNPSVRMSDLRRIVDGLDNRHNAFFIFFNVALQWDLQYFLAFKRWRNKTAPVLGGWLDVLNEALALNSLAAFAWQNPKFCYPEVFDHGTFLEGKGIGHPCIFESKRVPNDFALGREDSAAVITGSNMSGKSTFLRSLGLNMVLARVGAPVCADEFKVSAMDMRTCMRARDDLERGLSYFYAEIQKLKQVVAGARVEQSAGKTHPLFFLLDEMLSGTNSRERGIGGRAVLRYLVDHGSIGVVATHDLLLSQLAGEHSRIRNYHFTDTVKGDEMFFDYRLRKGPVSTSNALFLMRKVGIDIPPEEENAVPAMPDSPSRPK